MNGSDFLKRITRAYEYAIHKPRRLSDADARRIFSLRGRMAFPEAPGKECHCQRCHLKRRAAELPRRRPGPTNATCLRCGYSWRKQIDGRPKRCTHCKRLNWDTPALKEEAPQMARTAVSARWERYYKANPDKLVARQKREAKKGTDCRRVRWDAYYKANPDKWIERQKREANKAGKLPRGRPPK